jgi:hypothetical protein
MMQKKSILCLLIIIQFSCTKECTETQNFYEIPIKCKIDRILDEPNITVLKVFNEALLEIESNANDNTFNVLPWNESKINKKVNYDTTFYVQVQKSNMDIELDSINFLYNVETDDCGTFVIKQMQFKYNRYINFTGTFNNNVCSFTFIKH